MTVVALVSDLAMQSQLNGAAARASVVVNVASSVEALLQRVAAEPPTAAILDLSHPGLDPGPLVERIRALAPGLPVIAFGPHVHHERLAAARQAGCEPVVSRGQFHAEMDAILKRLG